MLYKYDWKGLYMSFLCFEDDEIDDMHKAVNNLQMCFHPKYASEGKFSVEDVFELQSSEKEIMIIADKNLVSPICEIATNGFLKDKFRIQKVALFVTWTKYLNSRLTCGIGLRENDTARLSTITGEENRLQFLHGVDVIPATVWKDIAFGYRDEVPINFRFNNVVESEKDYCIQDDFIFLSTELAMVKIVQLIRTATMEPIDKFIDFMNWYADNLDIAESIMVYAAMVFVGTQNVSLPKNAKSNSFEQVKKGIKNQAWDITYIITWSTLYYDEVSTSCNMFATDDITQKIIIVNVIPPGQCENTLNSIFTTKAQRKKLIEFAEAKLGTARVRPFEKMQEVEKITIIKDVLIREYEMLQAMCMK